MSVPKTGPIPSPEDNLEPLDYREQFQGRHVTSKFIEFVFRPCDHFSVKVPDQGRTGALSPCEAAAKASLECMDRNSYDRQQCLDFFQAYRDCKKSWIQQRKSRHGRPSA